MTKLSSENRKVNGALVTFGFVFAVVASFLLFVPAPERTIVTTVGYEQATRTRSSYISRISSKYAETLDPGALTYENCYLKDDEWLSIDARSNGAFALCVFTRDKWYEIEQD